MIRVVRGRASDVETDRAVTRALVDDVRASDGAAGSSNEGPAAGGVAASGGPAVRVWTPHRQVAFGRRDARADGYDRARASAREHGFPPHERSVGGRAVAYTGSTVAFVRVEPIADLRRGMDARYDAVVADLRRALVDLGVETERDEPEAAWCPGAHSLSATGKIVGVAQRVQQRAAQVAGIVLVRDHGEIAAVLADVYDALDVPFDPDTVGSIARDGGDANPDRVARAVEDALVCDDERTVEHVA